MKKRVYRSEIELAKETTKAVVLLLIIVFLIATTMLVISGTVANILPFSKKDSSTKYVNKEIEIDTDNVNIDRLFNNVKVTSKNLFNDSNYSNKEKIIVKDLNTISKYRIASNIYLKELKFKNGLYYVDEKFVKDAYELLFGDGTYFREEQIPYYNNINLVFDGERYSSQEKVEEVDNPFYSYEKIVSVKRKSSSLDIVSAVLYYEKNYSVLCRDRNCEKIVKNLKKDGNYGDEYFNLYLEHNKNDLVNYTYHFEMSDDGFFYYLGYDMTN